MRSPESGTSWLKSIKSSVLGVTDAPPGPPGELVGLRFHLIRAAWIFSGFSSDEVRSSATCHSGCVQSLNCFYTGEILVRSAPPRLGETSRAQMVWLA